MTIHFTYTWLWAAIGVVWLAGVVVGSLLLQGMYLDGEPRWYVRLLPLVWPVVLPCVFVYGCVAALFFNW